MDLAWYATQPYISVMQTEIVTYHHLAIIYALSPVATICGSVVTGEQLQQVSQILVTTIPFLAVCRRLQVS